MCYIIYDTSLRVLVFLLGERKWQHQNANLLHLNALNVTKEIMRLKRTLQTIVKELRSTNSVQDAIREQNIKKQNNQTKAV